MRAGSVCLLAALVSGVASPALAAPVDAGAEPGEPLTLVETLLLFVGAPIGLFVLISLLAMAPSLVRSGRSSSLGWWSEPLWFGGPDKAELPAGEPAESASGSAAGGGASARW
jgi:hypothetical protein